MTATEELRRMLDERGIKHFDYSKSGWSQTQWEAPDGNRHFTYETYNNPAKTAKLVISWFPTPEQAIAATLGDDATAFAKRIEQAVENREPLTLFGVDYEVRGECERIHHGTKPGGQPRCRCSNCDYGLGDYRWAFCPKCGYRIRGEH